MRMLFKDHIELLYGIYLEDEEILWRLGGNPRC